MKVTNFTLYGDNPYSRMMYSALAPTYEPVRGTVDDAIGRLERGESPLLHVNWEEHLIRRCATSIEAELVTERFLERVDHYRELGGKLVWTIHNERPHELEFVDTFFRLRRGLGSRVDRIIVHSVEAFRTLTSQVEVDPSLILVLPHPSYLGEYEPPPAHVSPWSRPDAKIAVAFGLVRPYKGYDWLLETVCSQQTSELAIRIVGQPVKTESYGQELTDRYGGHRRVELDFRKVPVENVAATIRAGRCLVLPYERFLTSGVALLGLTLGVPLVAPDSPQMRETLPPANHTLLFERGDGAGLMQALERAMNLSDEELNILRQQQLRRARHFAPWRISRRLGNLFNGMLLESTETYTASMKARAEATGEIAEFDAEADLVG